VQLGERIGDERAGVGAEAVVVEVEMLQRRVAREEGQDRLDGVAAKGVVIEVDRPEVFEADQRVEKRRDCRRNLGKEAAGVDVGEVGFLPGGRMSASAVAGGQGKRRPRGTRALTLSVFFSERTWPSLWHAPMPSVLPRNLTSSTSVDEISGPMWASRSSAESSFRLWLASEKSLEDMASAVVRGAKAGYIAGYVAERKEKTD
jgi:hypothetical protein